MNALDFKGLFDHLVHLGDIVVTLFGFDYEVLTQIEPEEGLSYWAALTLRLISWGASLALGGVVAQLIFASGIMQSSLGLALVFTGVGVTGALAAVGLIFWRAEASDDYTKWQRQQRQSAGQCFPKAVAEQQLQQLQL